MGIFGSCGWKAASSTDTTQRIKLLGDPASLRGGRSRKTASKSKPTSTLSPSRPLMRSKACRLFSKKRKPALRDE